MTSAKEHWYTEICQCEYKDLPNMITITHRGLKIVFSSVQSFSYSVRNNIYLNQSHTGISLYLLYLSIYIIIKIKR